MASFKKIAMYFAIYLVGIATFLLIISEPFTMVTYFSDNSLLPGLVNREFSLETEAEYYLKGLEKLVTTSKDKSKISFATLPQAGDFIKKELDNFGLEVYEQNFSYNGDVPFNGTNIYSIIRGERSTNSESILLCAPFKVDDKSNTLAGVALSLALTKYYSTKSYWAKDVIILFVDHDRFGTAAWLDSYHDINFNSDISQSIFGGNNKVTYGDPLKERSGPMQAAIIVEIYGKKFSRLNVKIQGNYGQLPNLDLYNLVIELAARESITPFFHDKSLPFDLTTEQLYRHHIETAISFMKTQASMESDGLHGLFLGYAIQSLTLEAPEHKTMSGSDSRLMTSSLLNMGRLLEGIFRSLNNLTERFNRSFYFYIILSLRRFTSIGYYMIAFGIMTSPILLKAVDIYSEMQKQNRMFVGIRAVVLLVVSLALSLISTFNISLALILALPLVPIMILI